MAEYPMVVYSEIVICTKNSKRNVIPNPTPLPGTHIPFPYMIVADDAFPLKKYIMKPFSQIGLTPQKRI